MKIADPYRDEELTEIARFTRLNGKPVLGLLGKKGYIRTFYSEERHGLVIQLVIPNLYIELTQLVRDEVRYELVDGFDERDLYRDTVEYLAMKFYTYRWYLVWQAAKSRFAGWVRTTFRRLRLRLSRRKSDEVDD